MILGSIPKLSYLQEITDLLSTYIYMVIVVLFYKEFILFPMHYDILQHPTCHILCSVLDFGDQLSKCAVFVNKQYFLS
jgi:hypothetical protein